MQGEQIDRNPELLREVIVGVSLGPGLQLRRNGCCGIGAIGGTGAAGVVVKLRPQERGGVRRGVVSGQGWRGNRRASLSADTALQHGGEAGIAAAGVPRGEEGKSVEIVRRTAE